MSESESKTNIENMMKRIWLLFGRGGAEPKESFMTQFTSCSCTDTLKEMFSLCSP